MSYEAEHHERGRTRDGNGPRRSQSPRGGVPDSLLVGVLALLLGLTVFTWTATGLAALFSHGAWPAGVSFQNTPTAMRSLLTEPHDLPGAWPATPARQLPPGYGLFWGIFISQLLVLTVLSVFVLSTIARARALKAARRAHRAAQAHAAQASAPAPAPPDRTPAPRPPQDTGSSSPRGNLTKSTTPSQPSAPSPPEPQAPAPEVPLAAVPLGAPTGSTGEAHEAPRTTPEATAGTPADTLTPVSGEAPAPDAGATGTDASAPVQAPSLAAVPAPAPPTAPIAAPTGNDSAAALAEAHGAALVVTSSTALWSDTKDARAKLGPVHLFDPTHLCDTPARLRWSPHHGCADRQTAAARAEALLAPLRSPRPIDADVHTAAVTVLRCWLHAAALEDRAIRDVHRWALSKPSAPADSDPVRTLRQHAKAAPGTAGELEAVLTGHPERRASATELIRRALAPLSQLHVRNACSGGRTDRISLESFIDETGTLYVVGEDPEIMPILNALTQSVVEHGRRVAARSSAGRLDPPLTTILDLDPSTAPTR